MKLDEVDDFVEEEFKKIEVVVKPFWTKTKKVIFGGIGTIIATLYNNQEVILDYLKSLDFKYYILAMCVVSLATYFGYKNKKDTTQAIEEVKEEVKNTLQEEIKKD